MADQIADRMLDEHATGHRISAEPYPPPSFSETAPPTGFPKASPVFASTSGLQLQMPLFPGPRAPPDGAENEARFLDRSRTRSWAVDVRLS
ncbi:hypothetical protein [Streptomyces sp. NPDC057287]|uniref:hypothetical protein n=1 Tax=Streptomyces sp. NPDC057287 TaxID=3346086 RepID=UPI0036278F57